MRTRILAFAGNIGAGKDTCCKFLCGIVAASVSKTIPEFSISDKGKLFLKGQQEEVNENSIAPRTIKNYKFATPLKEFCVNVLGLDKKLVYGDQQDKETLTHILWENCPGIITNKLLYSSILKHKARKETEHSKFRSPQFLIKFHEPGPMSVREVLQYFGSEIVRSMWSCAWVQATINEIKKDDLQFALISDARFTDEFEAIKQNGGKIIKLTRSIQQSNHISEQDINTYQNFDCIIDNSQSDIKTLIKQIRSAVYKLNYFS